MSEKTIKLMPRVIRYFDKTTEDFVGEITLPELPLDKLQILFDGKSNGDSHLSKQLYETVTTSVS
ncbi:hypothetical protein [Vibrio sp. MACH09]|uniref:DUF7683 domain-containing protein n=1 Tax=Vibrio sp. MACH09 TaxID=3025122 RepID=UPI00295E8056|nr:hypothetical protein [Vibrio sp. MACH09]